MIRLRSSFAREGESVNKQKFTVLYLRLINITDLKKYSAGV
jgi:hypothetical protein